MLVQPVAFTASGIAASASPGVQEQVVGISFQGFTSVVVYNGQDNTGDVVAYCNAPGVFAWNYEVFCERGLYLQCSGSGKGTVWLA